MELNWADKPELELKKNERAPWAGILMPEQNYRNYKELEEREPETVRILQKECLEVCETPVWKSPFLWLIIGFGAGVVVFK